jgi:hypothetical protein
MTLDGPSLVPGEVCKKKGGDLASTPGLMGDPLLSVESPLNLFFQLLDQPHDGIGPVEDLSVVAEFNAGLLQAPLETIRQVSAGGTAAVDQQQVDVGIAGQGRAVQAGRGVASRDVDHPGADLVNDLHDGRTGRLWGFRIGQGRLDRRFGRGTTDRLGGFRQNRNAVLAR